MKIKRQKKQISSQINKQRGFSMVELGFVLIIGAIFLSAVISFFLSNSDSANARNETQTLLSGVGKLKQSAQAQGNYTGFTTDNLSLALGRKKNGTNVDSEFGADSLSLGTVTATALPLQYTQVIPASTCQSFISGIQGSANKILVQASAGAAASATNTVKDLTATTPLLFSSALTATACNQNGEDGLVAATVTIPVR